MIHPTRVRVDWYPEGHFSNVKHPTLEELNTGYNLSPEIVTGFELNYVDPTTESTATIFDHFAAESIRANGYEANIRYFLRPRDRVPNQAERLFYNQDTAVGFLGKRFGYHHASEFTEESLLSFDLYKFQADLPKVSVEDNSSVLLDIHYIPLGEAYRVSLINYNTYNQFARQWESYDYAHIQDVYTGEVYNSLIGLE